MNEQELRSLVRAAIKERRSGVPDESLRPLPFTMTRQHASHALFVLPAGADTDGPCLIEPAVQCNHCGYCKSYGH
jgi:hypothetical protein